MPTDINIQLRKMPFGKLQKLNLYLEPPSDKDWKALSSVTGRYDIHQVRISLGSGLCGWQFCIAKFTPNF